jgi:hypothetical protein
MCVRKLSIVDVCEKAVGAPENSFITLQSPFKLTWPVVLWDFSIAVNDFPVGL